MVSTMPSLKRKSAAYVEVQSLAVDLQLDQSCHVPFERLAGRIRVRAADQLRLCATVAAPTVRLAVKRSGGRGILMWRGGW